MPTIFDQIVADVRKREHASVHSLIKTALTEKVQHALAEEKKRLNESDDDDPAAAGERAAKLDNAIAAAEKRGDKDAATELKKRRKESGRLNEASTQFPVGSKVRMTGTFLRNTGQFAGGDGQSRWTVVECPCKLCASGDFVAVDEKSTHDPERQRHINAKNLEKSR